MSGTWGWHELGVWDGIRLGQLPTSPQSSVPTALSCGDRYKMTCEYTWPNHLLGSDKAAVSALLEQHGLQGDVAFGHTKLFIRSPQTLVTQEQSRARLIPIIVLLLQKVGPGWMPTYNGGWRGRGVEGEGGRAIYRPGGEGERGVCTGWGDGRNGCVPPGVGKLCTHWQGPQEPPLPGD